MQSYAPSCTDLAPELPIFVDEGFGRFCEAEQSAREAPNLVKNRRDRSEGF